MDNKDTRQNVVLTEAVENNTASTNWSRRYVERTHFCNWVLWAVYDGVLDPELAYFTDEVGFHFSEYMSFQNSGCWSITNPRQNSEVPLHDQKICVWCDIISTRIVQILF
jgi:hypothetical protein